MDEQDVTYLCVGRNNGTVEAIALYGRAGYDPTNVNHARAKYAVFKTEDGTRVEEGTEEVTAAHAGMVVMKRVRAMLQRFGVSEMYTAGLEENVWMLQNKLHLPHKTMSSIERCFAI